jgi:hypothetical protein
MLNRKKYTLVLMLTFVLSAGGVFAQLNIPSDTVSDNILLTQEHSFYGFIHSNGWGFGFRKGLNRDYFKKQMFEVEFLEMRSSKETKSINPNYYGSKSFYYGKLNACYIVRSGVGYQYLLNQKPYWGGVEVRGFIYVGGEIALAKPIYLKVVTSSGSGPNVVYDLVTKRYDPTTQSPDLIYGKASFFKGINQIKPYPGLYAKAGVNFEYGSYNTKTTIVEAGVIIDYQPKAVPIMAFIKNPNLIPTVYISLHFGKRYN